WSRWTADSEHRPLAAWRRDGAYRQRYVADIDVPGIELEPILAPVAPLIDQCAESGAIGAQHLDRRALRQRHVRRNAHRDDRHQRLLCCVEPHVTAPARQAGEQFHTLEYSSDPS